MHHNKNQGGFTLVEVAVGILISSIILFFASGMVLSATNLFYANRNRSEDNQIGDAVFGYIAEQLTYGNHMQIFPDPDAAAQDAVGGLALHVQEGRLYALGSDVFGEGFYLGRTVQLTAAVYNDYYVELSVAILDRDGNETYVTASTINVLNMELTSTPIEDNTADGDINPYITYDRQGD